MADKKDPEKVGPASTPSNAIRNIVTWDGTGDEANPINWSKGKKWVATIIVSAITFITPVSSSMIAPATKRLCADLGVYSDIESQLTISVFILGYALGPLILAPLSEVFGRVSILHISNVFFLAWTLGSSFAQNEAQMVTFRLLSGFSGGAPLAIAGGVLCDIWSTEERGNILSVFVMVPLLAPVLGPIAGGWIAEYLSWRWVFWSIAALDATILVLAVCFLRETYAPRILSKKAARLRAETGSRHLHTQWDERNRNTAKHIRTALIRPFILLGRHADIQFIATYLAYLYGVLYLLISTFPELWTDVYHESSGIGGLNYISLGIGLLLGSFISAHASDYVYIKLKERNNHTGIPEFRIPLTFIGSILVPIGLFWYGWSAQTHLHWVMPNVGMAIFAVGNVVCSLGMQLYIVDSQPFAASGIAAIIVLRSFAGFGFPLFASKMYSVLGYGWGNSVLGFIAIFVGIPAPWILWFYGDKLRSRSGNSTVGE